MKPRKLLKLIIPIIFLFQITVSISTAEEKERLVLMPLQGSGVEAKYKPMMESAIAEGLSDRYKVLYGRNVEEKIKEIYKKLSEETVAGQECDDTKCMQEIGIEFQAERVTTIRVLKNPQGYFLALNIINIYDNELVMSKSEPCEGCNEFQVIRILKQMAGGTSKSEEEKRRKVEEERKRALEERRRAAEEKKRREEEIRVAADREQRRLEDEKRRQGEKKQRLADDRKREIIEEQKQKGMVFIKGGCYQMGDTFGDGDSDEKPVHEVCVDDFYMGEHEVTVGEFREFVNETAYRTEAQTEGGCFAFIANKWKKDRNKYWDNPGFSQRNSHPVTCVSWNDANEYIQWKRQKTGGNFRFPTEAEWEYAARSAGKEYKYSWGNGNPSGNIADESAKRKFSHWTIWKGYNDRYIYTAPVKSFLANEIGLYDMTGNVWEWVSDWYGKDYYSKSAKDNPKGPGSGKYKVLRGGSWFDLPGFLRASNRNSFWPDSRFLNGGFRIAQD